MGESGRRRQEQAPMQVHSQRQLQAAEAYSECESVPKLILRQILACSLFTLSLCCPGWLATVERRLSVMTNKHPQHKLNVSMCRVSGLL